MKRLYFDFIVLSMFALLFSCSKKDEPNVPAESDVYISMDAELPELNTDTKGHVGQVATLKWAVGDSVFVFDENEYLGGLVAKDVTTEGKHARLNGTIKQPSGENLYFVASPAFSKAPEMNNGSVDVSLADQGSVNSFVAYSVVEFEKTYISSMYAKFTFASSQFQIYAYNMTPSAQIKEVTLVNVNDICSMKFSDGAVNVTGKKVAGYVHRTTNSKSSPEGENTFYIAAAPSETASDRFLRLGSTTESYYDFGFTTIQLKQSDYYLTMCDMAPSQAPSAEFSVESGKVVNFSQYNLYWDGNISSYRFEILPNDFRHYPDGTANASVNGVYTETPANTVGTFFFSNSEEEARSKTNPGSSASEMFTENADFTVLGYTKAYWKTLTSSQWDYLLNTRTTETVGVGEESARYAQIVVNNTKGLLLFPDTFEWNTDVMGSVPSKINKPIGGQLAWTDSYTITQFECMAAGGAVFIPCAGRRTDGGAIVVEPGTSAPYCYGFYWNKNRSYLYFMGERIDANTTAYADNALSLRVVHFK